MRRLVAFATAALVSACAAPPKPIVDLSTVGDPREYQKDLIECATLADYYLTSETDMTRKIVQESLMSGGGAVIGGAIMGSASSSIATGMTAGLVGGAIGGAINAGREQEIARNAGTGRCLQGRGYEVLNAKSLVLDPKGWCQSALIGMWKGASDEEMAVCVPAQEAWLKRAKEGRSKQRPAS